MYIYNRHALVRTLVLYIVNGKNNDGYLGHVCSYKLIEILADQAVVAGYGIDDLATYCCGEYECYGFYGDDSHHAGWVKVPVVGGLADFVVVGTDHALYAGNWWFAVDSRLFLAAWHDGERVRYRDSPSQISQMRAVIATALAIHKTSPGAARAAEG